MGDIMINFINNKTHQFYKYWLSIPREEILPSRKGFFPEDIPHLLPNIAIFELISADNIKFKLAGEEISLHTGFDRQGSNYLDIVSPDRRQEASKNFWLTHQHPCANYVILEYNSNSGVIKTVEAIGMPILNDQKSGNPLLYYCAVMYEISNDPNNKNTGQATVTVKKRQFIDIGAGIPNFDDYLINSDI